MPNTLQNMAIQYRAGHDIAKQNIALQNKRLQNNIFEFENHQAPIHAYRMSKIQNCERQYTTAHDTIAQYRTKHKNGGNEHDKERGNHQFKGN